MTDWVTTPDGGHVLMSLLVKVTLLLCAGWIVHAVCRRSDPRWRLWTWRAITAGVFVVIAWTLLLPQRTWTLAVLDSVETVAASGMIVDDLVHRRTSNDSMPRLELSPAENASFRERHEVTVMPGVDRVGSPPKDFRISRQQWLASLWLLVAVLLLSRLLHQRLYARWLVRHSTPCPDHVTEFAHAAARELLVGTPIAVRISDRFHSPFLTGIRPVIVLPRQLLTQLDGAQLRLVLRHELAHVRGRDMAWSLAVRTLQSLLWFHPLVWGMNRAHRQGCEAVCDALAAGPDRDRYQQFLAGMALQAHAARIAAPAGVLSASSDIMWRLRQLERQLKGRQPTRRQLVTSMTCAAAVVAWLSATDVALTEAAGEEESVTPALVAAAPDSEPPADDETTPETNDRPESQPLTAAAVADLARLQGVWQAVGVSNEDDATHQRFLIQIDGSTMATSVPPPIAVPRAFQLDADNDPKRMILDDGRVQLYRLLDSRLEISYDPDGGEPPADFDGGTVLTMRRLISAEQLAAVRNGLAFLCQVQDDNGSFGIGDFRGRVGIAALCGLALASGESLAPEDASERLERIVDYILSHQDDRGFFSGPNGMLYDHGYAVWCLSRLHREERFRGRLQLPLQRAVQLTVASQQQNGGWGYTPSDSNRSDLSNTAVQLRALAEARRQGFDIPESCLAAGIECLNLHQSASGDFSYLPGTIPGTFSCTAQAFGVMAQLGVEDGPVYQSAWQAFREYTNNPVSRQAGEPWFLYGSLYAVDSLGSDMDDASYDWYVELCDYLVTTQRRDGSWKSSVGPGGPDYATAVTCLILMPPSILEP